MLHGEARDPEQKQDRFPALPRFGGFWRHPAIRLSGGVLVVLLIVFQFFATKPEDDLRDHTAYIDTFSEDLLSLRYELPEVRRQLRDFGTFYESGAAARTGLNPYANYQLSFYVKSKSFAGFNPNLNPPVSLLVFAPMSLIEPGLGFQILWWVSISIFVITVAVLAQTRPKKHGKWIILWAICFPGIWDTLDLGQIYALLFACSVGAWILLERGRSVPAGILIGILVAIKPNFVVWPVLLFIAGYRRAALSTLACFAFLGLLPVLFFGPEVYLLWIETLLTSDPGRIPFGTNLSLTAFGARLGVSWIGAILSIVMLAGIALWAWRFKPRIEDASAVALIGAVLASPIGWIHYLLFLFPIFFSFRWNLPMKLGGAMLAVPIMFHFATVGLLYRLMDFLGVPDSRVIDFFFVSLYSWGFLVFVAGFMARYWPEFRALVRADRRGHVTTCP